MRDRVEEVLTAQTSPKVAGSVAGCDKSLGALVAEEPVKMRSMLKGLKQSLVTWKQRAARAFLCLHPDIYGDTSCSPQWQMEMIATALGVDEQSLRK